MNFLRVPLFSVVGLAVALLLLLVVVTIDRDHDMPI
jgi:hypothetical protein